MVGLIRIEANEYGIDFLGAWPDVDLLVARGCRYAAIYLKNWNPVWVDRALAAGLGIIPIGENDEESAAGGTDAGIKQTTHWVKLARKFGVPAGCPINLTKDTSAWTPAYADYFVAGEKVLRDAGYAVGGYGGKKLFAETEKRGVRWDVRWAWSAIGAEPAPPEPHVQQGTHHTIRKGNERDMWTGVDFDITGFCEPLTGIDTNVSRQPFTAWGVPATATHPQRTARSPIITTPVVTTATNIIPNEGDDMSIAILELSDADAIFLAECTSVGRILKLIWVDGNDPNQLEGLARHKANADTVYVGPGDVVSKTSLPAAQRHNSSIVRSMWVNRVPTGDQLKPDWSQQNFAGIG